MFLGLVDRPIPEYNFDSKVLLKRICKIKPRQQAVTNKISTHDAAIDMHLNTGGWRDIYSRNSDMPFGDQVDIIPTTYDIEEDVAERLMFTYEIFVGENGNKKTKVIEYHQTLDQIMLRHEIDKQLPQRQLLLEDESIKFNTKKCSRT